MKYCPQCQTTYADDLLKYCLKDGAPLGEVFDSQPTIIARDEDRTVASIRQVEPIRIPVQQAPPPVETPQFQNPPPHYPPPPAAAPPHHNAPVVAVQPETSKSRTGLTVGLTILGTLLLLAVGGIAAMLYFRDRQTNVAASVNDNKPTNVNRPANANANAANVQKANQNANASITVASPTATATPQPALDPEQAELISVDVEAAITDWKNATENFDLGGQLDQYAETVNYYSGGRVNRTRIRADKDRALGIYDSININISNLKVTPDAGGETATALFDKEWDFAGAEKNSSGKVRQQLTLKKFGNRWLITGERDLKVYYVNN